MFESGRFLRSAGDDHVFYRRVINAVGAAFQNFGAHVADRGQDTLAVDRDFKLAFLVHHDQTLANRAVQGRFPAFQNHRSRFFVRCHVEAVNLTVNDGAAQLARSQRFGQHRQDQVTAEQFRYGHFVVAQQLLLVEVCFGGDRQRLDREEHIAIEQEVLHIRRFDKDRRDVPQMLAIRDDIDVEQAAFNEGLNQLAARIRDTQVRIVFAHLAQGIHNHVHAAVEHFAVIVAEHAADHIRLNVIQCFVSFNRFIDNQDIHVDQRAVNVFLRGVRLELGDEA